MDADSVDTDTPLGVGEGGDSTTSGAYQTTTVTSADHATARTMVEDAAGRSAAPVATAEAVSHPVAGAHASVTSAAAGGQSYFKERTTDGNEFASKQMSTTKGNGEPESSLPAHSNDAAEEEEASLSAVIGDATLADPDASMEDYGDEDAGVIRCICECDDDDGFTIQCDKCLVWQHCACFGMSQASVPEEYHCEQCDPRPVDVGYAKAHQQKRREAELKKASLERSIRRQNQANTATVVFQGNSLLETAQSGQQMDFEHAQGHTSCSTSGSGGISRSRKPSQQLDLSAVNFGPSDGPTSASATPGNSRSGRKRGGGSRGSGAKRSSTGDLPVSNIMTPRTASMMSIAAAGYVDQAGPRAIVEDRMELEDNMAERMEAWSVEFTPTSQNLVFDEDVRATLGSVWQDHIRGHLLQAERGMGSRLIAPVVGKRVKTLANLNASTSADAGRPLENEIPFGVTTTQGEHGLSAIGNECTPVEIITNNLGEHSQKTYVKQISEMASASIFNSLLQIHPQPSEPQRPWSANRTFHKPMMHGLFADVSIPAGCFIQEYSGEIGSADVYRRQPVNQYASIGTSKPCVHMFPPPLNLCIDARQYGSTSRFARFSCHPNAVLRPIVVRLIVDDESNKTEPKPVPPPLIAPNESQPRFGLFAISDIPKTHEITLGWEWDDAHIVHILPQLVRNPMLGMIDVTGKLQAPLLNSNQRSLERQRRHAAITALVERGDFPYTGSAFSLKMNSVLTILLGSCLCACIGSASPPGGANGHGGGTSSTNNSSASSNNAKKQDCAISQMLRLSQGMSLLNVHIPGSSSATGKSNRKSKAPDFEPLVGARRWWRPSAMPPTPRSSEEVENGPTEDDKNECYRSLSVPFALAPGGKVGRVTQHDFDEAMERDRISARMEQLRQEMDADDVSEGEGDVDSDASSLTEPLPHNSGGEEEDGDDSNLLADTDITIAKNEEGVSFLVRTALPPKKRVSGTRIKAINSAEENSDVEYKGQKRKKVKKSNEKKNDGRKRSPVTKRTKSVSEQMQDLRKKRKKRLHEQSSPLTSAPSDVYSDSEEDSDNSPDVTPTPTTLPHPHNAVRKRIGKGGEDGSSSNDARKMREAKKKAQLVRKRRRELLGELVDETESSSDGESRRGKLDENPASSPVKKSAKKKPGVKAIIYSDEESEVGDKEVDVSYKPPVATDAEERDEAATAQSTQEVEVEAPLREAAPPPIEVPKAKLSLADYKKRLAERRTTSATSISNANTPLSTPAIMMPSPEKVSQPNTPLSSSIMPQSIAFAFPPMPTATFRPQENAVTPSALTPTTPRAEFAPPPPRFPRPTTPPRSISASATMTTATGEVERSVSSGPVPDPRAYGPATVSASPSLPKEGEQMTIQTEMAAEDFTPEKHVSPRTAKEEDPLPLASDNSIGRRGFIPPAPAGGVMPAATTVESTMTFNPPRAPRALINSILPGGAVLPEATTTVAISSGQASPPASQTSLDTRHSRTPNSYDGVSQHLPLQRNVSPVRTAHNAPRPSIGGPYQSSTPAASGASGTAATAAASPASLNDFANVPKGPARMREREREREMREREHIRGPEEREIREPIPPPRERDWDRDREWEWDRDREQAERDRDRERDYPPSRDVGFPRDHLRDREMDYFYSRRDRLEDEEERGMDFPTSRPPPPPSGRFAPRGGGVGGGGPRGGFAGPSRGLTPWSGRARTRGRGSRGSGVWR